MHNRHLVCGVGRSDEGAAVGAVRRRAGVSVGIDHVARAVDDLGGGRFGVGTVVNRGIDGALDLVGRDGPDDIACDHRSRRADERRRIGVDGEGIRRPDVGQVAIVDDRVKDIAAPLDTADHRVGERAGECARTAFGRASAAAGLPCCHLGRGRGRIRRRDNDPIQVIPVLLSSGPDGDRIGPRRVSPHRHAGDGRRRAGRRGCRLGRGSRAVPRRVDSAQGDVHLDVIGQAGNVEGAGVQQAACRPGAAVHLVFDGREGAAAVVWDRGQGNAQGTARAKVRNRPVARLELCRDDRRDGDRRRVENPLVSLTVGHGDDETGGLPRVQPLIRRRGAPGDGRNRRHDAAFGRDIVGDVDEGRPVGDIVYRLAVIQR